MTKSLEFTNPNWEAGSHFSLDPKITSNDSVSEKIGLHALDASNKIYQMIVDGEKKVIEAEEKSSVDVLTNCWNRNYFEKYKKENFDALRDHNNIALIFVDINGLKEINDARGHKIGDNLIKYTADFLKENFRPGDIVVRLGGDEFVVICHNSQCVDNFEESLHLDTRLDLKPTPNFDFGLAVYDKNSNYSPDFAYGIAVYDKNQDFDLDNTLKRSDHMMYKHKMQMGSAR